MELSGHAVRKPGSPVVRPKGEELQLGDKPIAIVGMSYLSMGSSSSSQSLS